MKKYFKEKIKFIYYFIIKNIKFFRPLYETGFNHSDFQIRRYIFFYQKILRKNGNVPWPVHHTTYVSDANNIKIGVNVNFGDARNIYIQAIDKIRFGDYSVAAAYTKFISSSHNLYDIRKHDYKGGIIIGRYCWIGIGATILPGVVLGDHVQVGAGSVVTKSFPEGYCVIAGNPAKIVKYLDKSKVIEYTEPYEYVGYKRKDELTEKDTYYNDEQ